MAFNIRYANNLRCTTKSRDIFTFVLQIYRVGIVGGLWVRVEPPQFMSTEAHFWVKIGHKRQSLGKISNISTADPRVRSIPTLHVRFRELHSKPHVQCWNWPKRTQVSAAEMLEILPTDWSLWPIFTQKWASVDMNSGFNPQPSPRQFQPCARVFTMWHSIEATLNVSTRLSVRPSRSPDLLEESRKNI